MVGNKNVKQINLKTMFNKNGFLLLITLFFVACEKYSDVEYPDFSVSTDSVIYKVGDTIKFKFTGSPDIITFYSGELGFNYDYRDGRIAKPNYRLFFESQCRDGSQKDQIKILVSADFDGNYTLDSIQNATWIDLTSKFSLAPPGGDATFYASGWGDFYEFIDQNADTTDLYFAVKQVVMNQEIYGQGNLNRIRAFQIKSTYETLNTPLYGYADMQWQLFSTPNKQPGRAALEATQMTLRNSWWTTPENYYVYNTEDWVVSKLMRFPKSLDLGPDKSIGIKGITDVEMSSYSYIYLVPGTYKLVFKAINVNIKDQKENIQVLNITVTE